MAFLLHQLLSESAAKYPDREAIAFKDRTITYAELERESNKVAHMLVALKIAKGDRIGLYFNRGIESIISACGILKAGATYVPLDPASPVRRVTYIIEKCGIKSLLTLREKLTKIEKVFPEHPPLEHIVLMDGIDPGVGSVGSTQLINGRSVPDELGERAPIVNIIDSDIAYILFTSGSTGNPKGVMISHLNSLTFVNSACDFFRIEKEDRLSNIAPLHFDMSVFDIFVAFKAGACVVAIPETTAIFPVKLAEYIPEKKISVWNSVPSALSLLATYKNLDTHDLSSLRLILFAGELFPLKYLRLLQEAIPGARFCNMYGQTEANSSTYYWVDQLPSDDRGILPIGRALPNFEVFALDEDGELVDKPEQEGELYVRASTVALGYWGELEKTANSFVRNPLRPDLRERVYKTGDLVRLDSDGNYVFLGRKDHMIKSRGYRIELGEIETVIANHEQVKNSVVIAIPDELIGNRIAAVIVPLSKGTIRKEDVIRYCATRLPRYMIPEIIEFRDSLPMTSSGKVDRKEILLSSFSTCNGLISKVV
jgi:amino acid adenylation domain-containing protein